MYVRGFVGNVLSCIIQLLQLKTWGCLIKSGGVFFFYAKMLIDYLLSYFPKKSPKNLVSWKIMRIFAVCFHRRSVHLQLVCANDERTP